MKQLLKIFILSVIAFFVTTCADKEVLPVTSDRPQVTFDKGESFEATVNEPIILKALVTAGGRVTSRWYVGDILEGSGTEFKYTFTAPGMFTVKYIASNSAGEFTRDFIVTVSDRLKISLSTGDSSTVVRKQTTELKLVAIVESGANVTHEWKIDGAVFSTEAYLRGFILSDLKSYSVTYRGANAVGEYTKTLSVKVEELPLEVSFSNTDAVVFMGISEMLDITATILCGGIGATHSWKVDGVEVSNTATLSYAFPAIGVYTLAYHVENAKGEEVNRTWTINVMTGGYIFADFEDNALPTTFVTTNKPGLTVEVNPNKTGENASAYVLKMSVSDAAKTSNGNFNINFSGVSDLSQYNKLRVKIYRTVGNDFNPAYRLNGAAPDILPVTAPTKFDEWETIEFNVNFAGYTKEMMLRPFYNKPGVGGNPRVILMDDFELIK